MDTRSPQDDRSSAGELQHVSKQAASADDAQEERAKVRQRAIELIRQEQEPILADLARVGFTVDAIEELYQMRYNYQPVIPLLLQWLPRVTNPTVKEMIVRALSVSWARPTAAPALVEEYRGAPDHSASGLKWAVGSALAVVADDSVLDDVVQLVRNQQHGKAREMVALALGNMKDPRAVDILTELLDDEEVAGHAIMALGKLKAKKARPLVAKFLNDKKAWVRTEAKRALARIDKAK